MNIVTLVMLLLTGMVGFCQNENTLLWEVSGNDLKAPSYLFGTIHVVCPDDFELDAKVIDAYEKSQQLVLELDMDDPNFMMNFQKLSVNPNMKNLSDKLSEEDLYTLNTFFKKHYQADMSQLGIMKPLALTSMITLKMFECNQLVSYELKLIEKGKAKQWDVLGLETIKEQFDVFDAIDEKKQLQWLVDYVNKETEMKEIFSELSSLYKKENIVGLYELMKKQPEFKEMEDTLLYERNKKWIDKIVEIAEEKPTFFAFGAAHLVSEKGVIALLKKKGYNVKPIMN